MINAAYFIQFRNENFIQFLQNVSDTAKKRDMATPNTVAKALDNVYTAFQNPRILDRGNAVTTESNTQRSTEES